MKVDYPKFEDWLAEKTHYNGTDPITMRQYTDYLTGWRNSMPWKPKGKSIAYDRWAESRWDVILEKHRVNEMYESISIADFAYRAWSEGLAAHVQAYMQDINAEMRTKTTEEAADFMLEFRETIAAMVLLATDAVIATTSQTQEGGQP